VRIADVCHFPPASYSFGSGLEAAQGGLIFRDADENRKAAAEYHQWWPDFLKSPEPGQAQIGTSVSQSSSLESQVRTNSKTTKPVL